MRSGIKRLFAVPIRAPRLTIALLVAVTAVLGRYAAFVQVDSAIENLLPADDPERSYYEEVKTVFGSEEVTLVGIFADDVFAPATLAKIDELSRRLSRLDGVEQVLSLTTAKGIEEGELGLRAGRLLRRLPRSAPQAAAFTGMPALFTLLPLPPHPERFERRHGWLENLLEGLG